MEYAALAARFGTPLYVYDLDRVDAARRDLIEALPPGTELYYAVKANPHPELVRALRTGPGQPCRVEISSTGELDVIRQAGYAGADVLYTGPGKTDAELTAALAAGVRTFSVESPGDLTAVGARAAALGVTARCLLRVNSASASASTSIRMTGTPSQFGFDSETLPDVLPQLRDVPGAELTGLHFYPLSNARDEDSLIAEFRHTIGLAADLSARLDLPLRLLDIGGGFAAPYAVPGSRPRYEKLRTELEHTLDRDLPGWRDGAPRIAFESGRHLVGDAGTLLTRVVNVKVSRGRKYVIADAGINTLGGMSGLGRLLPVAVEAEADGERERASLVGPLCTPGDILGRDIALPALDRDDLVTIPNVGAYGPTASLLMFLGRPAPTEVVVRGDEVLSVSRLVHTRDYADPA